MSRGQTEVLGLLIAVTSLLLLIAAAGKDCWRQGAKDQLTSVGLSSRCRGLWGECVHDSLVRLRTCDVTVSYMEHLPADLFGDERRVGGDVFAVCGFHPNYDTQPEMHNIIPSVLAQGRLMQISGALCVCGGRYCSSSLNSLNQIQPEAVCLVCGFCTVCVVQCAVLWYGMDTYTRYKQEVNLGMPGITFEFGLSCWLMVGSVFCSLTSTVLTIRSVTHMSDAIRMQPRLSHSQSAQTDNVTSISN